MTPPVAIDLTRLFLGPASVTPRGIDRVDLGYARHFLQGWQGDCVATLPTPWGIRLFDREHGLRIVNAINALWGESRDPAEDPAYAVVKAALTGATPPTTSWKQNPLTAPKHTAARFARLFREAGFSLGQSAVRVMPAGTVYLNVGQIGIALPPLLAWLNRRPDVRPVFMLHDTIPIDHAEYVRPWAKRFHRYMVANTARHAAGLIVTTEAAEAAIRRELLNCGRSDIAVAAAPLPVAPAFLDRSDVDPDLLEKRYFVVCGTIEPRKNHLLLLNVWRELIRHYGARTPKLILVGSRRRKNDAVIHMLERSDFLRGHVIEVAGLSSPGLRRLLAGASALLMPSFAEGFGLPIVEALACGTPVIASDLPAHREVGGPYVTYLSPIDGLGWLSAIRAHAQDDPTLREKLRPYRSWTWNDYFRSIEPFIASVGTGGK